jgi:SusD family
MRKTNPGTPDSERTNMRTRFLRSFGLAAVVAISLAGCNDILTVPDPQRYTSDDLDNALPAVANGVEGAIHEVMDSYVIYQALLADVYEHTGTWSGYDEIDHGRIIYGASSMDGVMNSLLRARWFAGNAEERFIRVMGDADAAKSPLTAQVRMSGAMADLYLGSAFCEAPAVNDGPAVPDTEILKQAITKFTAAMQTAQAAGSDASEYGMAALAGRAQAKLLLGMYDDAAADASQIPDGFSYDAKFNNQSSNSIVTLTTATFNYAAGLQRKWWPLVDDDPPPGATFMHDPYTGEYDHRKPVYFTGRRSTDNITPHYSQWKYTIETDDIPMLHSSEMRLIQAEALMRKNDYAGAMAILNDLRADAGLSALPVPTDATEMRDILLNERNAEMFMEGMRATDLWRFGVEKEVFAAMDDPERPASGRPIKFSMSSTEALYNNQINDDLAQRCLPRTN